MAIDLDYQIILNSTLETTSSKKFWPMLSASNEMKKVIYY